MSSFACSNHLGLFYCTSSNTVNFKVVELPGVRKILSVSVVYLK